MATDTTTISAEALHRLQVEAAFGRGEEVECQMRDRNRFRDPWEVIDRPAWDWASCNYRVAEPAAAKRTAAEICTEIEKLVAELRSVTE